MYFYARYENASLSPRCYIGDIMAKCSKNSEKISGETAMIRQGSKKVSLKEQLEMGTFEFEEGGHLRGRI